MSFAARLSGCVRWLVADYRLNWILAAPVRADPVVLPPGLEVRPLTPADLAVFAQDDDPQVRKIASYSASGADGFVLAEVGRGALGVVHFCDGDRYAHASTWPLRADQLALIDIVTLPVARGQGHAARLIAAATPPAVTARGKVGAICFIWWNHHASLSAFRRAGWRAKAFSVELVTRRGRIRSFRVKWHGEAAA